MGDGRRRTAWSSPDKYRQQCHQVFPDGGEVEVQCKCEDDRVVFTVRDNGPGIAPERRTQIFERYWQGKSRRGGRGLGLYIAKGIIDAHEGQVWVESEPGCGTTFYVAIPRVVGQVWSSATRAAGTAATQLVDPDSHLPLE